MPHRLDHIGRRIQDKLNAASLKFESRNRWRLYAATPRRYWERRFTFRPTRIAHYDEIELAFIRVLHDRIIERTMRNHAMAVDIVVRDGDTNSKLHLTAGVAGNYGRCIDDLSDKLLEWTQSYGRQGDLGDDIEYPASRIVEIVVLVGKRQ